MKRINVILAVALGASTVISEGIARADDAELQGLLDENVVTTASKVSEVGSAAPATSTVITSREMQRYGIHTIGEAIDFLSLGASGASPSSGLAFGVRGVNIENDVNEHILLLVDGHAVNDFSRGSAPLDYDAGVPMELIDHIEVVLGPGSVLYGSNAMLGVVNVVTKRAKDLEGVQVGLESDVAYGVRGYGTVGYDCRLFGRPSELTVAAEYRRENGPNLFYAAQNSGIDPVSGKLARYGDGPGTGIWGGRETRNELHEEPAVFTRFVSGNLEATFRALSDKAHTNLGFGSFDDANSRTITHRYSGEVRHRASLSPVLQINTRVYADSYDSSLYFAAATGRYCTQIESGCIANLVDRARWAGVEIQTTLDWLKDGTFVTLAGVDPRLRSGQSKTDVRNEQTGAPLLNSFSIIDRTDGVVGAYLQQTWKPLPWLGLNGGARLDADPRFAPVVSPRLAASVNVWQGGVLKAVYAEAFRAPSFNESYYTSPVQPANDLRPESVRSVELSLDQRLGAQHILLGAFKSTWANLVQLHYFTPDEAAAFARDARSLVPPDVQFQNVSRIQNYGVNAGFEGSVLDGRLRYGANVTGARSLTNDGGSGPDMPLTTSPRVFGNARVSYAMQNGLPTFGLVGLYVAKTPVMDAYGGSYAAPPYAPPQGTLRATVSGDFPWVKGLSYRISASYQFADYTSEVVGPLVQSGAKLATPYLHPNAHLLTNIGLQYHF